LVWDFGLFDFFISSANCKNKFEAHFDENANDQFHEENSHRYHTPNKLHVKNSDCTNEKPPRTPKPR
jgi:hypothetical protein